MSETGRYYIVDQETGRKFCVEPILGAHTPWWGDLNPATGKIEGHYGEKYEGAIEEKDSIITKENGYEEIFYLEPGISPDSYIEQLIKNE